MKATTVVLEPIFWRRPFNPDCQLPSARNRILTSKRLDEHVNTFVPEFVSTSGEQIDGVFQVKVVVAVEVTSDEIVDLLLGLHVQVLEFVHSSELLDVQTVRQDTI